MTRGAIAIALFAVACTSVTRVRLVGGDGVAHLEARVRVADTAEDRRRGLRGTTLAQGEGLWLRFPIEDEVCIRNVGVEQAIDVVFLDAAGRVREVVSGVPAGEAGPLCRTPTGSVLEVPAGAADAVLPDDILRAR